jgi:hypothetical protein
VAGVEVGIALVVEVVDEPGDGVELLVLVPFPGVGTHARLDPEEVLSERIGLDPLGHQRPCIVS